MPKEELKPGLRLALRLHEIGDATPYRLFFAGKGTSGRCMGLQSDAEESRQERSLSPIQPSLPTRI